jgi:hypothetical protein
MKCSVLDKKLLFLNVVPHCVATNILFYFIFLVFAWLPFCLCDKTTRKTATVEQQHHCTGLAPTEGCMNIRSGRPDDGGRRSAFN